MVSFFLLKHTAAMKKTLSVPLYFLIFHAFFVTGSYASQRDVNTVSVTPDAILAYVNQYRIQHGLTALEMNPVISKEAQNHSQAMAMHTLPFGHSHFNDRIHRIFDQVKRNPRAGAENVAYNYKTAKILVENWLTSPGHKRNIVGNYRLTGIGVAWDKEGKPYYTQIFLR